MSFAAFHDRIPPCRCCKKVKAVWVVKYTAPRPSYVHVCAGCLPTILDPALPQVVQSALSMYMPPQPGKAPVPAC